MEIEIDSMMKATSSPPESDSNHSHNPIKRLILVGAICFLFMIVEIVGGYLANSLAIMTDAAHLLSDLVSFSISIASLFIAKLPASGFMSYGYHRAEIIGALLSVALIWGLTIWLLFEAVNRVIEPQEVNGEFMLVTAVFGLLCNIIMAKVLHSSPGHSHSHSHNHNHFQTSPQESPITGDNNRQQSSMDKDSLIKHHHNHSHMENVNIRAAFLHILGDLLQSIGVIIAAVIIVIEPEWQMADPICTFLFSIIVVFTTVPITKQAISVLMEASPTGINLEELNSDLQSVTFNQIPEVIELHDLHVWSLSIGKPYMSCHLMSSDPKSVLEKATRICQSKFGISHTTIQIEQPEQSPGWKCGHPTH